MVTDTAAGPGDVAAGPALHLPGLDTATLLDAFRFTAGRCRDRIALRTRADRVSWTWAEFEHKVDRLAAGLHALGVRHGESVALMLTNRPEFAVCDMAVVALGATPFSIYNTSSPDQIRHMVGDAQAHVVITELAMLEPVRSAVGDQIGYLVLVDGDDVAGTLALDGVMNLGSAGFRAGVSVPGPEVSDVAVIIYTSGTTGPSKGVQLTHHNVLASGLAFHAGLRLPEGGRVVSWLPAAHMAERISHYYLPLMLGLQITYCPDMSQIAEYLPEVRPSWFHAVPRVWEKFKAATEARILALPPSERARTERAIASSRQLVRLTQAGLPVPDELAAQVRAADETVFARLRATIGLDAIRAVHAGAAATSPDVLEFFHAIGLRIGELWALSESAAAGTVNPPGRVRIGTVGPALPGVEVRVDEHGELQLRGEFTMLGYRNLPLQTAEAFASDGWLRTGDLGTIDADGYVRILGRKKELIINSSGKNMSPVVIEEALKTGSPIIGQAAVVGDGRKYNVALIVLDLQYAAAWATDRGIEFAGAENLATHPAVVAEVSAAVNRGNATLARVEQVKKFHIVAMEWLPSSDELTPTMKLRRRSIAAKYAAEIEAMYED